MTSTIFVTVGEEIQQLHFGNLEMFICSGLLILLLGKPILRKAVLSQGRKITSRYSQYRVMIKNMDSGVGLSGFCYHSWMNPLCLGL